MTADEPDVAVGLAHGVKLVYLTGTGELFWKCACGFRRTFTPSDGQDVHDLLRESHFIHVRAMKLRANVL